MRRVITPASKFIWAVCACAAFATPLLLAAPSFALEAAAAPSRQSSCHGVDQGGIARSQVAVAPDATDDDSQSSPHELPRITLSLAPARPAAPPNLRLVAVARETIRRDRTLVSECLRLQI